MDGSIKSRDVWVFKYRMQTKTLMVQYNAVLAIDWGGVIPLRLLEDNTVNKGTPSKLGNNNHS